MDLYKRCHMCLQCLPFPEVSAEVPPSRADSSTSHHHDNGELSSTPALDEHIAVNVVEEDVASELNSKLSGSSTTAAPALNVQVEVAGGETLKEDQGLKTVPAASLELDSTPSASEHGTLSHSTAAGTFESHGPPLAPASHNEQLPPSDLQGDAINLAAVDHADDAGEPYEASMDSLSAASYLTFEAPNSSDQQQQQHRGRHRQQLRQQLRGFRHHLKQGGQHIKEEGSRHLQTILNNINNIKNQQSMAPQIDQ